MNFKNLNVISIYCLFCVCLMGYNSEAQDQSSTSQTEIADTYLSTGIEKMESGAFEEAIEDFDEAIKINPQLTIAYYYRGSAKANLGRRASEDYIKVIEDSLRGIEKEIDPQDLAEAYYYRAIAKLRLLGRREQAAADTVGTVEQATADIDRALEINPDILIEHNAEDSLRGIIEIDPQDLAETYYNRGIAKLRLGRREQAAADIDRALEINPDILIDLIEQGRK